MRPWFLALALLGGCSDPELRWRVELADGIDRDAVALVRAEVARGSCDSPGDVVFASEIERDAQPAMQPGALGEGPHAFRAVAVDLACRIVGRGCADVSLPRGGAVVTTVEPSSAEDACDGAACDGAGRCGADGGPPDAGLDATSDAGCVGPACDELVPSNVPAEWIDPDAGPVSIVGDVMVDTSSCTAAGLGIASSDVRVHPQDSGPELCVIVVGDFTVPAGASMHVSGTRPLVILASGAVTIAGDLDLAARHRVPGAGGAPGGRGGGGGPAGGIVGDHDEETRASGGGGGGLCGAGGEGGASGPGDADGGVPVAGGAGGAPIASTAASPLLGGSSGGSGVPLVQGGLGGAGGGALQITAVGSIEVRGVIDVSGGGGGGGGMDAPPPSGGGGGSGGMVLLEAPVIRFEPLAMIRAAGGGGGGAAGYEVFTVTEGGAGEDGRLARAGRAAGGIAGGAGTRTGEPGGAGGGADVLDGDPGGSATRQFGDGGGGGGGAGCIVLRTGDGEAPENLVTNPTSIEVLPIRTE